MEQIRPMTLRDAFLAKVAGYLAARKMSERAFGLAAVNDHRFLVRLRANKATLDRIGRAEAYMDANPPGGDANAPPPQHGGERTFQAAVGG